MMKLSVISLIAVALACGTANAGVILESTDSIEVVTSAAGSIDYTTSWADTTTSAFTPGKSAGNISTATTTTVVTAPSASTFRSIRQLTLYNASATVSNTVTVQRDVSATNRLMFSATLCAGGCSLVIDEKGAVVLYDVAGRVRQQAADSAGFAGSRAIEFLKVGSASEATGVSYSFAKDSGFPGAWIPGSPGLNGANVSCSTAGDATIAGSPLLPNPTSGAWYLTNVGMALSTGHLASLYDLQWYNTGINVTTTTLQSITFPSPVSRDANGAALGEGVLAALVATAAIGGGAVTNTTLTYTNSAGTGSRTATMASWPGTAVVGTIVPFQLQAGDTGIRSIQGITLGTTYTSGSLSLVTYNTLASVPNPVANVGGAYAPQSMAPGVRLWNGTCFQWRYVSSATTATTLNALIQVMER